MDPEDPDSDPDHSQNWIISSFYLFRHILKISSKSVQKFLSYLVHKPTNKPRYKHNLLGGLFNYHCKSKVLLTVLQDSLNILFVLFMVNGFVIHNCSICVCSVAFNHSAISYSMWCLNMYCIYNPMQTKNSNLSSVFRI